MAKDMRVTRIEDLPGPKSKEELEEMKMPYEEYCRATFDPGNEFTKPEPLRGINQQSLLKISHDFLFQTRPQKPDLLLPLILSYERILRSTQNVLDF